jgi:hypothetical protein
MAEERSLGEQEQKQPRDTQRYVRCMVGYIVGKRLES